MATKEKLFYLHPIRTRMKHHAASQPKRPCSILLMSGSLCRKNRGLESAHPELRTYTRAPWALFIHFENMTGKPSQYSFYTGIVDRDGRILNLLSGLAFDIGLLCSLASFVVQAGAQSTKNNNNSNSSSDNGNHRD